MKFRNIVGWVVFVFVIATGYLTLANIQNISDWWKLKDYQPSEKIVKLADDTTMKDQARRVFYVNHPKLDIKKEFNDHCQTTEQSIVLGCFVSNQGIFLLEVDDPRLDGVIEVTAAHEVLHAMYDRLSGSEREKVDKMTAEFFKGMKDERIRKAVESYRKKDASIVPNELHSILGTEVRELTPELENYYKKYFKNRLKIVEYSEKYENIFIELREKVDDYDRRLEELKGQIEAAEGEINARNGQLDRERAQLDALLAANSVEEYNDSVGNFNQLVAGYNGLVNQAKQLINEYNQIVESRNALATQEQELAEAIDSNSLKKR